MNGSPANISCLNNTLKKQHYYYTSQSSVLILILNLCKVTYFHNKKNDSYHTTTEKIKTMKLNDVQNEILRIANSDYKIRSAIYHECENLNSGHHTSFVRSKNENWILVNDLIVEEIEFQKNGKKLNFFMENI